MGERQMLESAGESLPPIEPDVPREHRPQQQRHPDVRGQGEPDTTT